MYYVLLNINNAYLLIFNNNIIRNTYLLIFNNILLVY